MRRTMFLLPLFLACGSNGGAPVVDAGATVDASATDDAQQAAPDAVASSEGGADAGWCPRSGACGTFAGDPQTDPHNCGVCGHDCAGGACEAGECVPLADGVLATGQHDPVAVAVDDTNVYWLNRGTYVSLGRNLGSIYQGDGQLMKCAIAGCNNHPTVLADLKETANLSMTPSVLATDSTSVYWIDEGVRSCSKEGCACASAPISPAGGAGFAMTSSSVFWTSGLDSVFTCPISGCTTPTLLATSTLEPLGIVTDGTGVYWTLENGRLGSCAVGGCSAPTLEWSGAPNSSQAATRSIFVDDTNLYWTNNNPIVYGSVMQCAKASCTSTLVTLADGRDAPNDVVADATNVYWAEGNIYACAIGGCNDAPKIAVTASASAFAIDAAHVYYAQITANAMDGRIMVAPK